MLARKVCKTRASDKQQFVVNKKKNKEVRKYTYFYGVI